MVKWKQDGIERLLSWTPVAVPIGDGDVEDHSPWPAQTKEFLRPHLKQQLGTVVCSCHPS
jgi:hypothetical protein